MESIPKLTYRRFKLRYIHRIEEGGVRRDTMCYPGCKEGTIMISSFLMWMLYVPLLIMLTIFYLIVFSYLPDGVLFDCIAICIVAISVYPIVKTLEYVLYRISYWRYTTELNKEKETKQ